MFILSLNFVFTIPECFLNSIKLVNFSQTHPLFLLVCFNTLHGRHVSTIWNWLILLSNRICFHFVAFLVLFFLHPKGNAALRTGWLHISAPGLSCWNCFLEGCSVVKSGYTRIFILTMAYRLHVTLWHDTTVAESSIGSWYVSTNFLNSCGVRSGELLFDAFLADWQVTVMCLVRICVFMCFWLSGRHRRWPCFKRSPHSSYSFIQYV